VVRYSCGPPPGVSVSPLKWGGVGLRLAAKNDRAAQWYAGYGVLALFDAGATVRYGAVSAAIGSTLLRSQGIRPVQ
jgi:hypothetical protein